MKERERLAHTTLRLFKFALPHWRLLVMALLANALYAAAEGAFILLVKPFLRKTFRTEDADLARRNAIEIGLMALGLAPIMGVSLYGQIHLRRKLVLRCIADIRKAICDAILPQSMTFFERRRSGDFISRITNDVGFTEKAFDFLYGDAVLQPLRFAAGLTIALWTCWPLALIMFAALTLVTPPVTILARRIRKATRRGLEKMADVTDAMQQIFTGIRVVKAFQMEEAESHEFAQRNDAFVRRMMKMVRARALSRGVVTTFAFALVAGVIIVSAELIYAKKWHLTWPAFFQFGGACWLMQSALRKITRNYNDLHQALGACRRIFEIIDHVPEIRDQPNAVRMETFRDCLAFRHVSFAYDSEEVLHDLSFEVRKGETIALVGKSGAGKSTLVDLIARFYDPTKGRVEVDGVDLRRVQRDSWLGHVAMVTQQTFLFNRSVADNIGYGRRGGASREEIEAAARAANIHDFIVSLPQGYDTEVGEFGVRLSGGQRQRVAIARAILKNAPILILDEAMVGLDSEAEAAVREAIVRLMQGRTTFAIAHDLTTIQHADRIFVLRDGRIVESGSHAELLALKGEYFRLRNLQFGNGA